MPEKERAVQRKRKSIQRWTWETDAVLLIVTLLFLLMSGGQATGAERHTAAAPPSQPPQRSQPPERFLQQFISSSLAQGAAQENVPGKSPSQPLSVSVKPIQPQRQLSASLTTAATKMVLALGAVLGLLVVGGYLVRRYLLKHTFFGNRNNLLRVLARTNIAPKAAVALLEVPGKVLVIGITANTLTALGEVEPETLTRGETVSEFAAALEQSTPRPPGETKTDDALLRASEAIQQKVRRLKQL